MKIICGFLCVLLFLLASGCDILDEEECPVNCSTVVTDPNGLVIECHCPN